MNTKENMKQFARNLAMGIWVLCGGATAMRALLVKDADSGFYGAMAGICLLGFAVYLYRKIKAAGNG